MTAILMARISAVMTAVMIIMFFTWPNPAYAVSLVCFATCMVTSYLRAIRAEKDKEEDL